MMMILYLIKLSMVRNLMPRLRLEFDVLTYENELDRLGYCQRINFRNQKKGSLLILIL